MEETVKLLSASLTLLIAIIAVYIAYQQAVTARRKLKSDLFDKRFTIYNSYMDFLGSIISNGNVTIEDLRKFVTETKSSYFLFGKSKEVSQYLDSVYRKAVKLRAVNERLNQQSLPIGDERSRLAQEDADLLEWFSDQYDAARKMFGKYLDLD
jgi:hypothetical protein